MIKLCLTIFVSLTTPQLVWSLNLSTPLQLSYHSRQNWQPTLTWLDKFAQDESDDCKMNEKESHLKINPSFYFRSATILNSKVYCHYKVVYQIQARHFFKALLILWTTSEDLVNLATVVALASCLLTDSVLVKFTNLIMETLLHPSSQNIWQICLNGWSLFVQFDLKCKTSQNCYPFNE